GTGLTVFYGQMEIFSNLAFEVVEQSHIGIIGPNGGGKTSLLRIMVGEQEPDAGQVHRSRTLRIGYVPQVPPATFDGTLADEIRTAFDDLKRLEEKVERAAAGIESASATDRPQAEARYAALFQDFDTRGGYTYEERMDRTVSGLGLSAASLQTPVGKASGGERTRAAMAKALLADPDVLILDEPTNHLDLAGLAWLEQLLSRANFAFVVVSHDRYFLDRVVNQIWEIDHGRLLSFPGNYAKYRVLKAEMELSQRRDFEKQQKYIAKEESFIRRYGAGQRAQEAQGRATRLARLERLDDVAEQADVVLATALATRTARTVVRTENLKVGFVENGQRVQLLAVPDLNLERGSRVAVIGSNGAGKTTLIKTLLGVMPPLDGTVAWGGSVKPGYYWQGLTDLPEQLTVLDALIEVTDNLSAAEGRAYLARFLFRGDDAFQRVGTLSGGQRSRLALARLMITQPNVLVLDEPTNHLDIPSREALEEVLVGYNGTLIFISHDRQLITLLAKDLWIVDAGTMETFRGTFSEWVQQKGRPTPPVKAKASPKMVPIHKPPPAKKKVTKPAQDMEQVIFELEEKMQEIERQLQLASEEQDVAAVARLGAEHHATKARLEQTWAQWGG
ncbi:MAG: ABC-F family ATP-binding cassette domain-containing protein, partial [Chloroflexi bacterium]|nr:ABC-F family ATP-binding cassette domain-containing protein [Chloroflexota bacterium]